MSTLSKPTEQSPEDEELTTISMSAISPRPQEDTEAFQSSVGSLSIRVIGVSCSLPLERTLSVESASKVRCFVQPGQNSIKTEREECCKEDQDSQRKAGGTEPVSSTCEKLDGVQNGDSRDSSERPFMSIFQPGTINYQSLLETGVSDFGVIIHSCIDWDFSFLAVAVLNCLL